MTQADFTIANQTFPNTRTELNTSLQALATNSAGNSAPSTTFASQWWFDSDGNQLYIRNKDNDAWVKVVTIGATSDKIDSIADSISIASTGGVTITTADNSDNLTLTSTDADASVGPNLRLYRNSSSPADNDYNGAIQFEWRNDNSQDVIGAEIQSFTRDASDGTEDNILWFQNMTGGTLTEYLRMDNQSGQAMFVVNENSNDIDFRVESNGNSHMLFVDAGNDRVGVNTDAPHSEMHIVADNVSETWSAYDGTALTVENNDTDGCIIQNIARNSSTGEIWFGDDDGRNQGRIRYEHSDNALEFWTNGGERVHIASDGDVFMTKTSSSYTTVGHEFLDSGRAFHTANGGKALSLVRNSSNGAIMDFYNSSGSEVGSIETAASGIGIKLGGTASANLLDDYEEGTWTATLSGTGSSSGQGYDNQTMQYTKIGRVVYLTGMLDMNSLGTLGGDYLKITGLPFTPDSSNSNSYQPITTHHVNVSGDTTGAHFGWTVYASNSFMYVFEHTHGGATQATTSGDYENGTTVGCSGAYITAS